MGDLKKIKDKDLADPADDAEDQKRMRWLGGFFDGRGSCGHDNERIPIIQILNTNPKAAMIAYSLFRKNGIDAKVSERSKPSKSSKKKRWDVFVKSRKEVEKAACFLLPYVYGKRKHLQTLIDKRSTIRDLKYVNHTCEILIHDDVKLFQSLGFERHEHQVINEENVRVDVSEVRDINWLAGFIDAKGVFKLDKMDRKGRDAARFTPLLKIEDHNKRNITCSFSVLKNWEIGAHLRFQVSETKNRAKWTVMVSGFKRIKFLCYHLLDCLILRKEQLSLLNLYIHRRLKEDHRSVDELGSSTREAVETMEKNL